MSNTTIGENLARINAAIANGQRLHVGVTLSFVGGGSDKFWTGLWAGDRIAVNYGRHGSKGQFQLHIERTQQAAAKKMWDLLRAKTGKGYAVVDAAVLITPHIAPSNYHDVPQMVSYWDAYRDARSLNPRRPLNHPELLGKSPRTGTQGAQVLLDIIDPTPEMETLLSGAVADPTERFLPPLIMSRPDVPEEAKFLAALAGTAKVVL